ncbi:hypothetical protein BH11PSE3_BH11PSE3_29860 [soil metagenome]
MPTHRSLALALLAWLCLAAVALAANFPPLSGGIVDQANIIPRETRTALETKLTDLETKSGIQLVVATVNSLEGDEIEPYANALFRTWKLGEKNKNNGVLLLVAPNERRVRIEVGYGLEGTLTDALSSVIIRNAIAPRFKDGDFAGGITRGVDDVITVLTTDASEWQKRPSLRLDSRPTEQSWLHVLVVIIVIFFLILRVFSRGLGGGAGLGGGYQRTGWGGGSRGGWGGGGWGGGSSSCGGFSGGGGSSGGGGASGRW